MPLFEQNCVGCPRIFFGHIKGTSGSYDFLKPYSESGEYFEPDGAKISISEKKSWFTPYSYCIKSTLGRLLKT